MISHRQILSFRGGESTYPRERDTLESSLSHDLGYRQPNVMFVSYLESTYRSRLRPTDTFRLCILPQSTDTLGTIDSHQSSRTQRQPSFVADSVFLPFGGDLVEQGFQSSSTR